MGTKFLFAKSKRSAWDYWIPSTDPQDDLQNQSDWNVNLGIRKCTRVRRILPGD